MSSLLRTTCYHCEARSCTPLHGLSREQLEILNAARVTNTYKAGQILFYQGNRCLGLHFVAEGTISLSRVDSNGHQMLMRLAHDGDALGYRAYFSDRLYNLTAQALRPTTVCFIDTRAIETLIAEVPEIALRFMHSLGTDLRESEALRQQTALLPVRQQLVHLLLSLRTHFGECSDDGQITIDLPIARTEIASMLGARAETIIRTMRLLERDKVATFRGRSVVIENLDLLLDEVESPESSPG